MNNQINIETRDLFTLERKKSILNWLDKVISHHDFSYSEINYIFYNDDELLEINQKYLGHNFYTDIITFDNTLNKTISADIAISIDRVKENAGNLGFSLQEELHRVMVHGILHCIGFRDKTDDEKAIMSSEEDKMLNMFHVEQLKQNEDVSE